MRLRNKKTGEIRDGEDVILENLRKNGTTLEAICIDEIKEEWEDYEEPKEQYYIKENGAIGTCGAIEDDISGERLSEMKQIGNYFGTKEEAEQAVERLRAWKRLKDKGFRFTDYDVAEPVGDGEFCGQAFFRGGNYSRYEIGADLNLLFGGEE